jgi:DNA-binding PadR family transcriptional regulator
MSEKTNRDLTLLEYVVLGLISVQPQTGYSIINFFSPQGVYSWSASPGSIYPILKRLEQQDIIRGELLMEHETRTRKLYRLSPLGEQLLDAWLRVVPSVLPLYEQREIAMWRFQFMEGRLNKRDIIQWIDEYLDNIRIHDAGRRFWAEGTLAALAESGQSSLHRQLILEAGMMEVNSLRTWLEMVRARMLAMAHQTGEYQKLKLDDLK